MTFVIYPHDITVRDSIFKNPKRVKSPRWGIFTHKIFFPVILISYSKIIPTGATKYPETT
ncbi:conserved hypothetical protein [delta proteobacterium NaphS2]|nr:conserved hypothetical protein [delta proteobacterium NaphS2]